VPLLTRLFQSANIKDYLWPQLPVAQAVIWLIASLFIIWLTGLVWTWGCIRRAERLINTLDRIVPRLRLTLLHRSAEKLPIDETEKAKDRVQLAEAAFSQAVVGLAIPNAHPVLEHLRLIFVAGFLQAHLETGELLRQTQQRLLRPVPALRVLLSVFLIIGLLGTLFGVANAAAAFPTGPAESMNIGKLLDGLRGAFAPSIVGVGCTIVASLLFAAFQYMSFSSFTSKLQHVTIHRWIPQLMPTTAQRLDEAAWETLRAAEKVASFAVAIEKDDFRLKEAVTKAADLGSQIAAAMSQMQSAVAASAGLVNKSLVDLDAMLHKFVEALSRWPSFETEIRTFYSTTRDAQQKQTEVANRIETQVTRHAELVASQTTSLEKHLQSQEKRIGDILERIATSTSALYTPVAAAASRIESTATRFEAETKGLLDELQKGIAKQLKAVEDGQMGASKRIQASVSSQVEQAKKDSELYVRSVGTLIETMTGRLNALHHPFEQAANALRDQSTHLVTQCTTIMTEINNTLQSTQAKFKGVGEPLVEPQRRYQERYVPKEPPPQVVTPKGEPPFGAEKMNPPTTRTPPRPFSPGVIPGNRQRPETTGGQRPVGFFQRVFLWLLRKGLMGRRKPPSATA